VWKPKGSRFWHIAYPRLGLPRAFEATGLTNKAAATALLRRRVDENRDLSMVVTTAKLAAGEDALLRQYRGDMEARGKGTTDIDKMIRAGEAAGWLRFLGYLHQADLWVIYAGARVFAYPSRYEGFGLPVVEAMASGVPVVTSSVSCLPEVAGNAAEFVHPDDVDGLRAILERLLDDDSRCAELRRLGLEQAKRFSWQRCAEETVAVYRRVATT